MFLVSLNCHFCITLHVQFRKYEKILSLAIKLWGIFNNFEEFLLNCTKWHGILTEWFIIWMIWKMFLGIQDTQDTTFLRPWAWLKYFASHFALFNLKGKNCKHLNINICLNRSVTLNFELYSKLHEYIWYRELSSNCVHMKHIWKGVWVICVLWNIYLVWCNIRWHHNNPTVKEYPITQFYKQ